MQLRFFLALSLLFCLTFSPVFGQKPGIASAPAWVEVNKPNLNYEPDADEITNSVYVLLDLQFNIPAQSRYIHFAEKIVGSEGIQSASTIEQAFDPAFQKLTFHHVRIHREGQVIDQLSRQMINTFQRETGMDRHLYDGSLTAVINLEDVRVGDVIEYAYTLEGFNPIHKGHYSSSNYLGFAFPVGENRLRVLLPKNNSYQFDYQNGAPKPKISTVGELEERKWVQRDLKASLMENNVPAWYDAFPYVSYSDYEGWSEVVKWAQEYYSLSPGQLKALEKEFSEILTEEEKEARILEAIRFVQDEVRYLGFESGMGAYQPKPPMKVMEQRFGDCKDKSLLLAGILQTMEVDAYPVLVNTTYKKTLRNFLPHPVIFDHCVMGFEWEGKKYWIDPTISNQRGNLDEIWFPDYAYGLEIRPGVKDLTEIETNQTSSTEVTEKYEVTSVGGPVDLTIVSVYKGGNADHFRSQFQANSRDLIQKEYLNYYSVLWTEIEATDPIEIEDKADKSGENVFTVTEHYRVSDFWKKYDQDNEELLLGEIYSLPMEQYAIVTKSPAREMPYFLSFPLSYTHEYIIDLPEDWPVEEESMELEGNSFAYQYSVETENYNQRIRLRHHYETNADHVAPEDISDFFDKHEKIKENLSYQLTYNEELGNSGAGWGGILLALLIVVALGLGAWQVHRKFDPAPKGDPRTPAMVGGWMILPLIGLILTPPMLLYTLWATPDFFNLTLYTSLLSPENFAYNPETGFTLAFELMVNLFLLVFAVLLLVQIVQRRSSLPILISIYYISNFVLTSLDSILVVNFIDTTASIAEGFSIGMIVGVCVWLPYFLKSTRVKETFVFKYGETEASVKIAHKQARRAAKEEAVRKAAAAAAAKSETKGSDSPPAS